MVVCREVRNEKQRLKRALKQRIRHEWTAKQAVDDIERQLQGFRFPKDAAVDTSCHPQRPAQKRLVEALTAPVDNTLDGQYQRRDKAIDAIIAYCVAEEGPTLRRTDASSTKPSLRHQPRDSPADSPLHVAQMSVFVKNKQESPLRCFVCVAKAVALEPNDPHLQVLIRPFTAPGDVSKHFRRMHLSNLQEGDKTKCGLCRMVLLHKMHLQHHAFQVHGTVS